MKSIFFMVQIAMNHHELQDVKKNPVSSVTPRNMEATSFTTSSLGKLPSETPWQLLFWWKGKAPQKRIVIEVKSQTALF